MQQAFRRKPITDLTAADNGEHALRRVLGAGDLVMLAIGAVIGAGIFGAIGTAAAGQTDPSGAVIRYGAGPALVFSFHSPSLGVGHTPYVRSEADLARFYDWWDTMLGHLAKRGVAPASVADLLRAAHLA